MDSSDTRAPLCRVAVVWGVVPLDVPGGGMPSPVNSPA
jgi:hypothetical protein